MAMFNGAEHVNVYGGSFVANASKGGLDELVAKAAPNAILNAGERADEVRCHPSTRKEVIAALEKFVDDDSPGRKRIMWLSGPAGAGKSAICQTVAERRSEQGQQAANFFFFRGDSTRSHSKPLVATLVYQLRHFYPTLDELLSDRLEKDPLVCSASIEKQFNQLISLPIETIQQFTSTQQQIVIIIDGLDECNNETRDQDQIVTALHTLAYANNSPFLVLVSSRAEPQLVMSFNRLGTSVKSMFLNDEYKPQKDIRQFVVAKFAEIKRDHHLARTLSKKWPTDADIDAIINKSSGQFIYGATVMRYIQSSSSSPALSLSTILDTMPSNHNPLAHLDAVYSYVFSKAQNIRAVKSILFARNCTKTASANNLGSTSSFRLMLQLMGYQDIEVESFFADLGAIIKVIPGSKSDLLEFYHASLEDYLSDKSRSTIYYINEEEIARELSLMCLRNTHDTESIQLLVHPLCWVHKPTSELSTSLLAASTKRLSCNGHVPFFEKLIGHIERLYWEHDKDQFRVLLQSWRRFAYINAIDERAKSRVQPQNPLASQYYRKYWMTFGLEKEWELDRTGKVEQQGTVAGPARSYAFLSLVHQLFDSLRRKVTRRRAHYTSRAINFEEDERGNGECGHGPYEFTKIRVKLHYQDDIRGITFSPDTPFSEFVNTVTAKFGKNINGLTMKLKDEGGGKITLHDDSDYEFAFETARKRRKGKTEGMLEIWCEDSSR